MGHEDFLITTTANNVSRKVVWDAEEPLELDMPKGWSLERVDGKFQLKDLSFESGKEQVKEIKDLDIPKAGKSINLDLPRPKKGLGRALSVEIKKLKSIQPPYNQTTAQEELNSGKARQLSMYYGQRYFLIRYRPVSAKDSSSIPQNAFYYERAAKGYTVKSLRDGFQIKIGTKKYEIPVGHKVEISETDFLSATFIMGVQWWRFRSAPTPDDLPPIETADSEIDALERKHLKQSAIIVLLALVALSVSIMIYSYLNPPPPKPLQAEVTLKVPKIIPPLPEVKKLEPPPPPPEPPKPKPKPEKKKPTPPKKKTEPTPPKPKPVARKEPPPAPAPAMHTTGKPTKAPSTTKADRLAKQQAAEQTQALQSLSFLTTSSKRATGTPKSYEDNSTGRFSNTPTVGGEKSTSNVLDNIAKGAPGDGNIKTRSSREVVNQVSFGNGKGKGLNDVQGKVSMSDISGGRGEGLGTGSGLDVSGAGEISESAIEKALAKYLSRFQYCYEKALLSDPGLGGNIVIQWDIDTSGRTKNPRVAKSQLNSNSLHSCVTGVMSEVTFPKPKGGSVTVKKTFSFSSSSL